MRTSPVIKNSSWQIATLIKFEGFNNRMGNWLLFVVSVSRFHQEATRCAGGILWIWAALQTQSRWGEWDYSVPKCVPNWMMTCIKLYQAFTYPLYHDQKRIIICVHSEMRKWTRGGKLRN